LQERLEAVRLMGEQYRCSSRRGMLSIMRRGAPGQPRSAEVSRRAQTATLQSVVHAVRCTLLGLKCVTETPLSARQTIPVTFDALRESSTAPESRILWTVMTVRGNSCP
jgi:hypothetical protein